MPFKSRSADRVADFLHLPAFAMLAGMALAVSDRFVSKLTFTRVMTTLAVIFASACIELVQARVGRTASLHDLIANSTGATATLLILQSMDSRPLLKCVLRCCSIAAVIYVSSGPVVSLIDIVHQHRSPAILANFANEVELERWYIESAEVHIIPHRKNCDPACNSNSLQVKLHPGQFPAVQLQHLTRDWTVYQGLAFELSRAPTDAAKPLVIQLRISAYDVQPNELDTVTRQYTLSPGDQQQVEIALDGLTDGERSLPLDRMRFVEFMAVDLDQPATIEIANLRLLDGGKHGPSN